MPLPGERISARIGCAERSARLPSRVARLACKPCFYEHWLQATSATLRKRAMRQSALFLWSKAKNLAFSTAPYDLLNRKAAAGYNAKLNMKKASNMRLKDDLRPEYDLALLKGGVRGKYARRYRSRKIRQ
jgi:hypothetical protein